MPVTLDPGGQTVYYARNDIETEPLSAVVFRRLGNGLSPIAPSIRTSPPTPRSRNCLVAGSGGCRKTRVIVYRAQGAPLPGGLLYSCVAVVDAAAALGGYPLNALGFEARDRANQPLPVDGADGAVEVVSEIPPSPTASATRTPSLTATPTDTAPPTDTPTAGITPTPARRAPRRRRDRRRRRRRRPPRR
ncbi:MAG: hypothetical protein U0802_00485 [Candidatus Binatia bacterium]